MERQTDNQQRKVNDIELAWLAGLWDGEGSIGMKVESYKNRSDGQHTYFAPYAQVVNTHEPTLEIVDVILKKIQVGHHISWPRPHQHPNGTLPVSNYKSMWSVRIHGLKRCKVLLEFLRPFLVTKHDQAELVWEFIVSRESHQYMRLPYTARETEIVNTFRLRRHGGKPTQSLKSLNDYTQGTLAYSVKV